MVSTESDDHMSLGPGRSLGGLRAFETDLPPPGLAAARCRICAMVKASPGGVSCVACPTELDGAVVRISVACTRVPAR